MPGYYELLEHTADIRIRVTGASLPELFRNAARALFDIIAEPREKSSSSRRLDVRVSSESRDELLADWLNELLSLSAANGLVLTDFHIDALDDRQLAACVTGAPEADFRLLTEVKAATYYGLAVRESGGEWQAEIVFDV